MNRRDMAMSHLPILFFHSMKETIMNTADMMIHMHQDLDAQTRTNLERNLMGHIGIDCAEFDRNPHTHSILVKYDPDAVEGMEILQMVRKIDPEAMMVGM
jgi:hypothetical protein